MKNDLISMKKFKCSLPFGIFLMLLITFSSLNTFSNSLYLKPQSQIISPKSSNSWVIFQQIHINNNWTESATTYDYITGSGTLSNPYLIENITFTNIIYGDTIIIENSNENFIIKNCTIKNSGASITNVEIKMINTTRGIIINNTISSNIGYGIQLIQSSNNSIIDNTIVNNTYIGIGLNESSNNIINLNTIKSHGNDNLNGFGVVLVNSNNNNLSENSISHNSAIGILLFNSSYNKIISNRVNKNYQGLLLSTSSNYNNVIGNNLRDNTYCYTVDTDSEGNIIDNNDCGAIGAEYLIFLVSFSIIFITTLIGLIVAIRKRKELKKSKKAKIISN